MRVAHACSLRRVVRSGCTRRASIGVRWRFDRARAASETRRPVRCDALPARLARTRRARRRAPRRHRLRPAYRRAPTPTRCSPPISRQMQAPVARIEFVDAGFLLDHFRAVHAEPRLPRHDQLRCTARPRATCRRSSRPSRRSRRPPAHAGATRRSPPESPRSPRGRGWLPAAARRRFRTARRGASACRASQSRSASSSAAAILLPDTSPMLPP